MTLAEVFQEHAIAFDEGRVAQEVDVLLGPPRGGGGALTQAERDILADSSGIPAQVDLTDMLSRSAAQVLREAADALSRGETAQRLGIAESRVSHRLRQKQLYAYAGAGRRPRFPSWQFVGAEVLPQLPEVLRAIPENAHPAVLRAFMTTPEDGLRLGRPVSPIEWLQRGGDWRPVAALAETLGEQI